MFQSVDLQK